MAMTKKPRVKLSGNIKKGEVFKISTIFPHKMENGRRKDKKTGKIIPRLIVNLFQCHYNDRLVFSSDLHAAVSANPFISFSCRADESGELVFSWRDDNDKKTTLKKAITVS
jgi:sulfur-oxidizing protein SoxZ